MKITILFPKLRGYFNKVEYWNNTNRGDIEMVEINQLISLLETNNYDVNVYVGVSTKDKEFKDNIVNGKNDLFILYPEYSSLINIAKQVNQIKKYSSDSFVLLVGYYTILNYKKLFEIMPLVDACMVSIDESPILNLAQCLSEKKDWENIPGLAYLDSGEPKLIEPPKSYTLTFDQMPWLKRNIKSQDTAEMLTISGCEGFCNFCERAIAREKIGFEGLKFRSVESVIDEIQYLVEEQGMKSIHFQDESFLLGGGKRDEWISHFCSEIKKRDLKFSFIIHIRVVDLLRNVDSLKLLKEVGLTRTLIGIENFSQDRLNFYKKGVTKEKNISALKILEENNIEIGLGFLLFDPFTGIDNIIENLETILDNEFYHHFLGVATFNAFPVDSVIGLVAESPLFHLTANEGLINNKKWFGYNFKNIETQLFYDYCEQWPQISNELNSLISRENTFLFENDDDLNAKNIANKIKKINLSNLLDLAKGIKEEKGEFDFETFVSNWEQSKEALYLEYNNICEV